MSLAIFFLLIKVFRSICVYLISVEDNEKKKLALFLLKNKRNILVIFLIEVIFHIPSTFLTGLLLNCDIPYQLKLVFFLWLTLSNLLKTSVMFTLCNKDLTQRIILYIMFASCLHLFFMECPIMSHIGGEPSQYAPLFVVSNFADYRSAKDAYKFAYNNYFNKFPLAPAPNSHEFMMIDLRSKQFGEEIRKRMADKL